MIRIPLELQAARLQLVKKRPYLAAALWALRPVEKPGLGTMAVDTWWRLYFDPAVCSRWTVEQMAGVLYHEVCHLLRDHASRMEGLDPRLANAAADLEVNDDLLRENVRLPDSPLLPAKFGLPEGLLAEEYYAALAQQGRDQGNRAQPDGGRSSAPQETGQGDGERGAGQGADALGRKGELSPAESDGESGSSPLSQEEGGEAPSPTAGATSQPGEPGSDPGGASGSEAGSADGAKEGRAPGAAPAGEDAAEEASAASGEAASVPRGGSPGAGSSPQSAGSAQPEAPSSDPGGPGTSHATSRATGVGKMGRCSPAPGAGRCGSCATGTPEWWEDAPPGEGGPDGVGKAGAELIRRDVAVRIKEHSATRGDVPTHWKRWAEEKLRPKVDWRRELASAVRRALADTAGAADYTYRRPSRRQGQVGNGKVIFPSLRQPVPRVAIIIDTSGSVDDQMLSQALAEIAGVLKALGQRESVHVLAVDAAVHACRRVFRPEQVQLAGGGGTDMGVGIRAAEEIRPRPEVVVILTDGYTPWPDSPPRGVEVVVGLLGGGSSPEWAKTIKIE